MCTSWLLNKQIKSSVRSLTFQQTFWQKNIFCFITLYVSMSDGKMMKSTFRASGEFQAYSATVLTIMLATSLLLNWRPPVPMAGKAIDLMWDKNALHKHSNTAARRSWEWTQNQKGEVTQWSEKYVPISHMPILSNSRFQYQPIPCYRPGNIYLFVQNYKQFCIQSQWLLK